MPSSTWHRACIEPLQMFTWLALLVAPSLVLIDLTIAYAMVTPTCARQHEQTLHLISAGFLATSLLLAILAAIETRRVWAGKPVHVDADDAGNRQYFLARIAVWAGALSSLVIASRWIPQWVLSPCFA
jgi:hypothetical protein